MATKAKNQIDSRTRRHRKVRVLVRGTASRPRLSIYRSNRGLYAQLINDEKGQTLVAASSINLKGDKAKALGEKIGKLAKEKKIGKVVFDRGGFRYAGKIKVFADAARNEGLNF